MEWYGLQSLNKSWDLNQGFKYKLSPDQEEKSIKNSKRCISSSQGIFVFIKYFFIHPSLNQLKQAGEGQKLLSKPQSPKRYVFMSVSVKA